MNGLLDIPISSVISLSAEQSVAVARAILRSECGYAKLPPNALTISSRLTVADGGIDAEINVPAEQQIPTDCIFQLGITGFQLKSGIAFKPWTASAIRNELLNPDGFLYPEVQRLIERGGRYVLLCTGHDLTPEQRNTSKQLIADTFKDVGVTQHISLIDVLGASQLVEFAERYPGTASILVSNPIQEAWGLDEWQCDTHMSNSFEVSNEQTEVINRIRTLLQGNVKHVRILGEPGLGKTRIVLEAVKAPNIAPYVIYLPHGSKFGQTKLFRQLLQTRWDKPLVLVLDELPEPDMADIWRHLKPRCGTLKLVTLDHGHDESHDEEIERLDAPRLSDEAIKKILMNRVGDSLGLDRWIELCEGSPRVAQAVADNLHSNPEDILRPPATVPVWARFLHGYSSREEGSARQLDCVTQHLALFSRFGYEEPVTDEAIYIANLVQKVDPTIGWAQFQEAVKSLRARRVLQGSRTLFFVPKALHIYLWKQFWKNYGRGFDFTQTFNAMPESLHTWFLNMFRFAGDAATKHVISSILNPNGIFSDKALLKSANGSRFLSTLAEANPSLVLKLLESTIGTWQPQELISFKENRQNIVWTLEKIAVWPPFTVRAINLLAQLAIHENADFSNNSTGTLLGLFRIGPEAAATESEPESRLPALLSLLRSANNAERQLGLKAASTALNDTQGGFRIVGPEYQGLKNRARLWIPATYGDWWKAYRCYFQALIDETQNWPLSLRPEVCRTLLEAIEQQVNNPMCTEIAFSLLESLIEDPATSRSQLNRFFGNWFEYKAVEKNLDITKRLKRIARRSTRQSLVSRLHRYVLDIDWIEWDESFREQQGKPKNRAKTLVNALAIRLIKNPEKFSEIEHLLTPSGSAPALWHLGDRLALHDKSRSLLQPLVNLTLRTRHHVCLHGYLSSIKSTDLHLYHSWVKSALEDPGCAWIGATINLSDSYVDTLFSLCLEALEKKWIDPSIFTSLRFGRTIESVPSHRINQLLQLLNNINTPESLHLIIELLELIKFDDTLLFESKFVLDVAQKTVPGEHGPEQMRGYYWKNVCLKLVKWDASQAMSLLNILLTKMGKSYHLSYHSDIQPVADELVRHNPEEAWKIIIKQFEASLPKWRSDLFSWLKGGLNSFDKNSPMGVIAYLPIPMIIEWIEQDPESRAALIAHAALPTLSNEHGGQLTRELLARYGKINGVNSGISATFHSGSWTGPTSAHLKRKRENLRHWLAAGYQHEVAQWIESEIEYLDRRIDSEETEEERSRFI